MLRSPSPSGKSHPSKGRIRRPPPSDSRVIIIIIIFEREKIAADTSSVAARGFGRYISRELQQRGQGEEGVLMTLHAVVT